MAGYVIHLAVANEYLKKYKEDIKNKEEFINGIIYPDQTKIKGETHYSPYYSSDVDLYEFVLDKKGELDTDFNKGYFLHLLTDYLFYNKYFRLPVDIDTAPGLYHDYDVLNDEIIEKYDVIIPDTIKNDCNSNTGDLIYLDRKKLDNLNNCDVQILFNRWHNRNVVADDAIRVDNWNDIRNVLL